MSGKKFKIAGDEIRPLAMDRGACYATDHITVEGRRVGYMYREQPTDRLDSGWRFFSGAESQEYVDDPNNVGIYDVNTIANYDPDIIPWLDSPVGTALERTGETAEFVEVDFEGDTSRLEQGARS